MSSYEAVKNAISRRIAYSAMDLIETYGLNRVMDAIELQASVYSDTQLDEIGTSDVSCWVSSIREQLSGVKR